MRECPAEIVMERPTLRNGCKWCWAVCQPDSNWGVWEQGSSYEYKVAAQQAEFALYRAHNKQGYRK